MRLRLRFRLFLPRKKSASIAFWYTAGYDANGKAITKNVLGKTQAEVKDKLRAAIEDSKKLDPVKAGSYTLEQWLKLWYSVYVEPQV